MLIVVEKVLRGKEIRRIISIKKITDDELEVIKKEQSKKKIDNELEIKEKEIEEELKVTEERSSEESNKEINDLQQKNVEDIKEENDEQIIIKEDTKQK